MDAGCEHAPLATQVNNVGANASRYLDVNAHVHTRKGIEAAEEKVTSHDMIDTTTHTNNIRFSISMSPFSRTMQSYLQLHKSES